MTDKSDKSDKLDKTTKLPLNRDTLSLFLTEILRPELFPDYCPNGLQVAGTQQISHIGFSVSLTLECLEQALAAKVDTLIVHHGIFWKHSPNKPLTGGHGQRIRTLIKNDLNLFAYHLPLDGHQEFGNGAQLAKALGFHHWLPLGETKLHDRPLLNPLGVWTMIDDQHPDQPLKNNWTITDWQNHISQVLNHPVIMASSNKNHQLQRLGIITGGANQQWSLAQDYGLDGYLTGEISEYNWHDAREANVHYFAGGHHATERFGIQALMKKIADHFKIRTTFFDSENPA